MTSLSTLTLGDSTPYLIRQTSRLYLRTLERRISRHGITVGMWFFLRALWEEDNITQAELSERVGVGGPTTVTAVGTLEKHGLVERRRSTADRRLSYIKLTLAGRAIEKELVPIAKEVTEIGLAPLSTAEKASLNQLLSRVYDALVIEDRSGGRDLKKSKMSLGDAVADAKG